MRAFIASLLLASSAAAQITGPSLVKQGEPIIASIKLAEGERAVWIPDEGAGVLRIDKTQAAVWGTVGKTCKVRGIVITPDENAVPVSWVYTFTIDGKATPTKPDGNLAQLAGDRSVALGTLYEGLAKQVSKMTLASVFKVVHADLLKNQGLATNGALPEINRRLEPVLVEPFNSAKVRSVLDEFVAELGSLPPPDVPPAPTVATAATYVYEKDQTAVPSDVQLGLNKLNRERKIVATLFEEDTIDGDGDVPDQYKVPLAAAQQAGLPSLVVTNGATVVRVVKAPTTEQQVLEAVQ